jgi:hypothetical protein
MVVIAVVLTACGGNDDDADDTAGITESESDSDNGQVPVTTGEDPQREREEVALPAGGPVDQGFPPGDEPYDQLVNHQCRELKDDVGTWEEQMVADTEGQDTVALYRGAAHACLGEWDEAIAAFNRIGRPPDFPDSASGQPGGGSNRCAREEVFAWLASIVTMRQADPEFDPEFVVSGEGSPCPDDDPPDTPDTTDPTDTTTIDPEADPDADPDADNGT